MRTTVELVEDILDETSLEESIIETFIDSANVFVTATLLNKGLSDTLLAEIERWLAAHMIVSTRERQAVKEGAGTAFIQYAGDWGKGLNGTTYGQTAMMLDYSGTLASLGQGKSAASIRAIPNFE